MNRRADVEKEFRHHTEESVDRLMATGLSRERGTPWGKWIEFLKWPKKGIWRYSSSSFVGAFSPSFSPAQASRRRVACHHILTAPENREHLERIERIAD